VSVIIKLHTAESFLRSWKIFSTQEIPRILRNPQVHYRIRKSSLPVPILSKIDPVRSISHSSKVHFNIILPSMPRSSKWSPSLRFPQQNLYAPLLPAPPHTCPNPSLMYPSRYVVKFSRWGVVSTSPNPQAGGPPLVGCPRLLSQCIRGHSPYLEAVPPSATWGRAMPWWQGATYHVSFIVCVINRLLWSTGDNRNILVHDVLQLVLFHIPRFF
jgi:hypothetical protein